MANNLFVLFSLQDNSREHAVRGVVEHIGESACVLGSALYVRSALSAGEAAERIWKRMDPADRLVVLDASRNEAATFNLNADVLDTLVTSWHLDLDLTTTSCRSPNSSLATSRPDTGSRQTENVDTSRSSPIS